MTQRDYETLLMFFRTLSNQERLVMLGLLAEKERSLDELTARLGLKVPEAARHVARLAELGLVNWRVEEGKRIYRLNAAHLDGMNRQVMRSTKRERRASIPDGGDYQTWERKILDNYIDGERVNSLPAGYKKRLVVLRWFADHFEPGRKYPEKEVNEIIEQHYEDYCTVRREMYEEGMMNRSEGSYWRLDWESPNL